MQGQLQVLDALLQYCLSHSDAFIVGQAGRAAWVETQAAVLHDSKGSFWLQSLDQSERRSAFLQQEHQKFNLDRFTKKLSALYPNWQLSTSADIPDSQLIVIEGNVSEKWQCWVCTCQTDFLWNRQRSRMESVFTRRGEWKRFVVSACKRVFHAGERFCVTFLNYSNRCRCFFFFLFALFLLASVKDSVSTQGSSDVKCHVDTVTPVVSLVHYATMYPCRHRRVARREPTQHTCFSWRLYSAYSFLKKKKKCIYIFHYVEVQTFPHCCQINREGGWSRWGRMGFMYQCTQWGGYCYLSLWLCSKASPGWTWVQHILTTPPGFLALLENCPVDAFTCHIKQQACPRSCPTFTHSATKSWFGESTGLMF